MPYTVPDHCIVPADNSLDHHIITSAPSTMKLLVTIFLLFHKVSFSDAFSQPNPTTTSTTVYEVCLSPGCIADGAEATFQKLQAIAPAGVAVKEGGCSSFCGNGPVVVCPSAASSNNKKPKQYKRVKGKKVLDILLEAQADNDSEDDGANSLQLQIPIPEALIQGYEMSVEADDALQCKDYEHAVSLYERAHNTAFRAALDMQTARDKAVKDNGDDAIVSPTGIPVGLLWLVNARKNEAIARMALGDLDGAVIAAQGSCNIGRNRCPEALETLAAIYEQRGDKSDELQALNNLFELPVDTASMSRQVENKRRELGFRRDKLQRELNKK